MVITANGQKGTRGFILVLVLLMLLVITLIGVSAINTATFENQISGNNRVSTEAFYVAEAGINELAGRFSRGATGMNGESVEIPDGRPASPDWKLHLVTHTGRASRIGYDAGNPNHVLAQSIQNQADFAVEVKHKVDAGQVITESGLPVYIVTSHGFTKEGGNKTVQVELHKLPEMDPPAALYSKAPVQVSGSSTLITGSDQCPVNGQYDNKTGVMTTTPTILRSGNPVIGGTPSPEATGSSVNIKLNSVLDDLKESANFEYEYNRDLTLTGYSDSWGTPTSNGTNQPLIYSGPLNIVYFKMSGPRTLKLAGGSHGAGILLVNGNLEINGGFRWYGVIIVTGMLTFTGGGEKNISGAVLAGESSSVASELGGNVSILYCSDAVRRVNDVLPHIKMTEWREVF